MYDYIYLCMLSVLVGLYSGIFNIFKSLNAQKYKFILLMILLTYFAPKYIFLTLLSIIMGLLGGYLGTCLYENRQHNADKLRWEKIMKDTSIVKGPFAEKWM